jgi:transposase
MLGSMRVAVTIELTAKERLKLESLTKGRSSSLRARERAAISLLAAAGLENQEIAARLGLDKMKVGRWSQRYAKGGLPAILKAKSRPGRIAPVPAALISKIIQLTTTAKPAGATHWSRASMAREAGVSESTVGRIWAAHGLKPHQVKTFKLSNDKHF